MRACVQINNGQQQHMSTVSAFNDACFIKIGAILMRIRHLNCTDSAHALRRVVRLGRPKAFDERCSVAPRDHAALSGCWALCMAQLPVVHTFLQLQNFVANVPKMFGTTIFESTIVSMRSCWTPLAPRETGDQAVFFGAL